MMYGTYHSVEQVRRNFDFLFQKWLSKSRSFVNVGGQIKFLLKWSKNMAQYKSAREVSVQSNNRLSRTQMVEVDWSVEVKISETISFGRMILS